MSHTRVSRPGRRRLVLLLLAVIAPSVVLIALSLRMIAQEGQLSDSRLAEEHAQANREFGQMVILTADRYRSEVSSTGERQDAVILVGQVEDGHLLLPWQLSEGLNSSTKDSRFSMLLDEAERLEFASGAPAGAVDAYRRALGAATDPVQMAYAELYLSRALQKAGRQDEADNLRRKMIERPFDQTDDFAIPFAFYAAQTLSTDTTSAPLVVDFLERTPTAPSLLSPQAGFMLRRIADTLSTSLTDENLIARHQNAQTGSQETADRAVMSGRLQEDFGHIHALLTADRGDQNSPLAWTLYADDQWLIGLTSPSGSRSQLAVILDAGLITQEVAGRMELDGRGYDLPVLTDTASPSSQWLGPSLPGVHLIMARKDGVDPRSELRLRYAFFLLAMMLVVGMAALGAFLWLRDTKREVQMAQMRSDFVSSVSHELKTPLTSIRLFAETLRFRTPTDDARRGYLDTILSESGRLTRLLNNVLDSSKIEKGSKRYVFEPVLLQDVIDTALRALAYPLQANAFEVVTDLPGDDIVVSADRDALEQVILNLMSNAMKFSGDQKKIVVSLRQDGAMALLEVRDFGLGIAADDTGRIFDRFYRAHDVRHQGIPGTGLGLSIVQHAVEAHGGRTVVTSAPGKGSTFGVYLPIGEMT